MKRNIPPISALVLAEAAARLNSVKEAAKEQLVTSSAVSHQISALEEWLGCPLFIRKSRRIELTRTGRCYLDEVGRILNELEYLTASQIRDYQETNVVRIQTTDSFANRWLVERLPKFFEQHPNITVTVETCEFSDPFKFDIADLGMLYANCGETNVLSKNLLPERIYPVCHPDLLDERNNKKDIFYSFPLIHDQNLGVSWQDWIAAAQHELGHLDMRKIKQGACYSHSHLAIKAAELGNGVALASDPLVKDAIRRGILVSPFQSNIDTGYGYYLVFPKHKKTSKVVGLLISWLEREASLF